MANRKISDLTALTAPATGDLLPIVDISEAAAADKNKKITIEKLFQGIPGNVGIGTSAPLSTFHIAATGECKLIIGNEQTNTDGIKRSAIIKKADNNLEIRATESTVASETIFTRTTSAESARIDSSGRLLVGTSTARSFNNALTTPRLQLEGLDVSQASFGLARNSANTGGPVIGFGKSRGTVAGSMTAVIAQDDLGRIQFQGADGTQLQQAAEISAHVDGTPGTNDMPGRLVFSTTADGAASPTERMVIKSNGDIRINQNTTSTPGLANTTAGIAIENTNAIFASRASGSALFLNRNDDGATAEFHQSGNVVGTITVTASATAYNTSSDYRLKENLVPLTGAIDRVNDLQVHRFNFIADPGKTVDGFIAHDAQAVVPECVTGTKDEVDGDGNPVYQGIDQSKLVPLLTAALQEAIGEIESLKARVVALESV
jgi:hypothetical protein